MLLSPRTVVQGYRTVPYGTGGGGRGKVFARGVKIPTVNTGLPVLLACQFPFVYEITPEIIDAFPFVYELRLRKLIVPPRIRIASEQIE